MKEPQMDADKRRSEINQITEKILAGAYRVSNTLGIGFLEKVYENALCHELEKQGLQVTQQQPIEVWYDKVVVGRYCADLVVEKEVLVELKVVNGVNDVHMAQCLNYLKATGKQVCLLLNFGQPRVEVKRIVHGF